MASMLAGLLFLRSLAVPGGLIILQLLCVQHGLAGHAKTDIVTTDDGNTFIGEIVSVMYGTLSLKTDAAGTLSIEWRRITSLTSTYSYRIELEGGRRYLGQLAVSDKPGNLVIVGPSTRVDVEKADVFQIVPVEKEFWRGLDGSVNFGFTYTQADAVMQYNLAADVNYRSYRHFVGASFQSIFNAQDGSQSTNQNYAQVLFTQVAERKWGVFEIVQLQSNPAQGYDFRLVMGGGAAKFLVENAKQIFALNLGLVYNRENVARSSSIDDSAEALLGINLKLNKSRSRSPSVNFNLQSFPSLTEASRNRAILGFGLSWKIIGDINFNFQVNDYYDSMPPSEDAGKHDLSVVTSTGWAF